MVRGRGAAGRHGADRGELGPLFALPVFALAGLLAGVRRGSLRTGPLVAALVLYVIVGGVALVKVLPLL